MLKIAQRKTDDGANVLADIEAGAVSAMYVTPGLDANMSITTGGNTYYYSQDGLNSVRTLTDSTSAVVNNYDYLPFGGAYAEKTTTTIDQRYTYTGREMNAVAPSMYYRNRQYNPSVGRFVSRWPDQSLDPSFYIYQFNMPIMLNDPWGDPDNEINLDVTMPSGMLSEYLKELEAWREYEQAMEGNTRKPVAAVTLHPFKAYASSTGEHDHFPIKLTP